MIHSIAQQVRHGQPAQLRAAVEGGPYLLAHLEPTTLAHLVLIEEYTWRRLAAVVCSVTACSSIKSHSSDLR